MLQAEAELEPVRVRLDRAGRALAVKNCRRTSFSGGMPSLRPRAMLMAGEVQRQADEGVPHRVGDELVELVADLPRQAADEAAGRLGGAQHVRRPAVVERRAG